MRDQIETFDADCDTLAELLIDHDLADGWSGHTTGLTCDLHLYGDQPTRLTAIIRAGLNATHRANHPSFNGGGASTSGAAEHPGAINTGAA